MTISKSILLSIISIASTVTALTLKAMEDGKITVPEVLSILSTVSTMLTLPHLTILQDTPENTPGATEDK